MMPVRCGAILFALAALLFSPISLLAQAPKEAGLDGLFVNVPNPISTLAPIKNVVDKARLAPGRNLKVVVFDFNPEGRDSATDEYGPCADLAKYIRTLAQNGVKTVAFLHGKTIRHSVLPVLACDDVVMSSDARLGEVATKDRTIEKHEVAHYLELAGLPRAGAVARMFDRDVKLVQATLNGTPIYVDLRKVETKDPTYDAVRVVRKDPIPRPAGLEFYNVEDARKFGIAQLQQEKREDLVEWYRLAPSALTGGPTGAEAIKACRIKVEGIIDIPLAEKIKRQMEMSRARKENTIFFLIETTGGGNPEAAQRIANLIEESRKDEKRPIFTVAYISSQAPDLACFIAFACSEIVMFEGADIDAQATLGDFKNYIERAPKGSGGIYDPVIISKNLVNLANSRGIPPKLVEGFFDPKLEIVRAVNVKTNERRILSKPELDTLPNKGDWQREMTIKPAGQYGKLTAKQMKTLNLARTIQNNDANEVYQLFGADPKEVRDSEPSILDHFAAFLRRTDVSIFLILLGIGGLILELKAPGLVIPGVISAICFILFFWAQTKLGGELIYLAIMLFMLGIALLGIEIFVLPGFGVTGVSGILLILAGLTLAGVDKLPESSEDWWGLGWKLMLYGSLLVGATLLAFLVGRFLPSMPYANRLMLAPPEDREAQADESSPLPGVDAAIALLGLVGTASSVLRPSGTALFGERYVDVVTGGEFIEVGTPIQVVEVEGTRIVVKKV